jgi:hypothetical protein
MSVTVSHKVLKEKSVDRKVPYMRFINISVNWYSKLYAVVRWNGVLMYSNRLDRGLCQRGIVTLAFLVVCLVLNPDNAVCFF